MALSPGLGLLIARARYVILSAVVLDGCGKETGVSAPDNSSAPVLAAIRSRRVTRRFTAQQVDVAQIRTVLEAARWAPSGGNRRLNVFVVVRSPVNLRLLKAVAPGILGNPPLVILIGIDHAKMAALEVDDQHQNSAFVDVGTAMENMLLAAHELGLGACPVMSFHRAAVRVILDLPAAIEPVLMILLGHPDVEAQSLPRPPLRLPTVDELTHWETYGGGETAHD